MDKKSNKFSLGFPEMDSQHEYCYHLFDAIMPIAESCDKKKLSRLLNEIEMYLMFHFECEERLMRMYEFPGYSVHQADHEQVGNRFIQFIDEYSAGAMNPWNLFAFLSEWLAEHSSTADIEYVKWIQKSRNLIIEPLP
jgi:hemerythrin